MSGYVVKDGHNVLTYDMTFGRLFVPAVAVPIPLESESLRIKASSENGDVRILVGGADVDIDNGYELTAGDGISIGGGLGQYIAANTIYVVAVGGTGYIHYMIHN
jgi:hypothetical protein